MNSVDALLAKISHLPVIPVVALNSEDEAINVGRALMNAGLNCIEITFRTAQAAQCIGAIKKEFPEMIVLAGTVLNVEQAQQALDMGSDAIVSPAINEAVVRFAQANSVAILPGVCNPQQIEQGLALGLNVLKFFPATVFGGTDFLKAVAPIYNVTFMPTGGITADTWRDYVSLPNVACCGGSWIASAPLIAQRQWQAVEKNAKHTLAGF
ncbi:MAG: bifunctional 4-hydroxy-2-oxoglutarate aldolase/2-dehydro-3-deoxy-phosphogluconate aldolase [Reinekea sp.]|nr:bifunctional 4-hydroxy-2-oxoglutarate aldolase/2-dehydro-3-deoxy-phosphogluconate aldolase [Reinekea sp.]